MPHLARQIFAVASPLIVLTVSVGIFLRYSDIAGPDLFIAASILGLLVAYSVWSAVKMVLKRKAAQRAALSLSERHPESLAILAELDRRAAREIRRRDVLLSTTVKHELLVALVRHKSIDLYRPAALELLGTLAVGANIARFSTTVTNRGTPINEPCLRIEFKDSEWIDLVLFDASNGKWPRQEDLDRISSR